jgi:hypothetical protein
MKRKMRTTPTTTTTTMMMMMRTTMTQILTTYSIGASDLDRRTKLQSRLIHKVIALRAKMGVVIAHRKN